MNKKIIAALVISVVGIPACYVSPRYGVSATNVEKLRELSTNSSNRISVAQFSTFKTGLRSITCRGVVPIKPPGGQTFEAFIQEALTSELKLAGIYAPDSPVKLEGKLDNIDFTSNIKAGAWIMTFGPGEWIIDMTFSGKGIEPFKVNSIYRFPTAWDGDIACQLAAQALPAATQDLIAQVIVHPSFRRLLTRKESAMIEGARPVPPPSCIRPDVAAAERLYTNDEIYEATQAGDLAKAKALLVKELRDQIPEAGNIKIEEYDSMPLLHLAASVGRKDIVDLLLAKGGDANARDNAGVTPLLGAAILGHKNVVEFLLTKGAEVNARDKVYGFTALHYVVSIGRKDMADLLLASKADINAKAKNGATPLYSAALHCRKDMVELLLAKGADVNASDNVGVSPLSLALGLGLTEVAAVLRRHGAKE